MKHNGTQGTYHSVPQNIQPEEIEEPKKSESHESVIENGQNVKTSPTPSKELQEDGIEEEKKPMTPLRKFCFVLSLLQCVLFIVAFGWLIPCKIPRNVDRSHLSHNWELNFCDTNVTSLAVSSNDYKPVAVIFGFSSYSNVSVYGIRAVNAFDGSSLWEVGFFNRPETIVCSGLDVNGDNVPDCIVTDDSGKMMAVSIKDGTTIWSMHTHYTALEPQLVSRPIVGKSCHESSEIYIYATVQDKTGSNYFVTVSAMSGQIKEYYKLRECVDLPENMMWRNRKDDPNEVSSLQDIVMSCANEGGKTIIYNINGNDICSNESSQVPNEMFWKWGIIDSSNHPLKMKLLSTIDGDNVVVLTHKNKITVYRDGKEGQDLYTAASEIVLKDFVIGNFTSNSQSNVAMLSYNETAKLNSILVLESTSYSSEDALVTPIENGTVKSIFTVHKYFNPQDTILLEIVSEVSNDEGDNMTDTKQLKEEYNILKCFQTSSLETVSVDYLTDGCHDSTCLPDTSSEEVHMTVLIDVDKDGIEELVHFTRNRNPSPSTQFVTLKLSRLGDSPNSCSSCQC